MTSYTTKPKSPQQVLMRLRSNTSEEPSIACGAAARLPTVRCQLAPSSDSTNTHDPGLRVQDGTLQRALQHKLQGDVGVKGAP